MNKPGFCTLNKKTTKPLFLSAVTIGFALAGCQTPPRVDQPNLGDLYKASLESTPLNEPSTEEIAQSEIAKSDQASLDTPEEATALEDKLGPINEKLEIYRSAREALQSSEANPQLMATLDTKIIALEIEKADEIYLQSPQTAQIYQPAIQQIKTWLQDNPESPSTQDLQYQLARLLTLTGDATDSESALAQLHRPNIDISGKRQQEVSFRIAERAFSQNNYDKAIVHYSAVLDAEPDEQNPFEHRHQALYMRAWSHLQINSFAQASQDFLQLLTDDAVKPSDPKMLDDTYRGIILTVNDAGGLEEIPNLVDMQVFEPVSMQIYKKLIDFYTKEKRWSEVVGAYQAYQDQYPRTENAKLMAIELLTFLEDNKQKATLRTEKANFITKYGEEDPKQASLYALELAEYHRSQAQALQKNTQDAKPTAEGVPTKQEAIAQAYAQSLEFYDIYLNQLKIDNDDIRFAYAETRLEAGDTATGRQQLNDLAQNDNVQQKTRQAAAYLALTSLETQLAKDNINQDALLAEKRQAATAFVERFPQHPNAQDVVQWLMVDSFKNNNFETAQRFAALAQQQYPALSTQAQQITADSLFATSKWLEAGQAFDQLSSAATNNPNRPLWRANAMKAYYQAARQSEPEQALPLFRRVYESGADDIASAALFEAAMLATKMPEQQTLAQTLLNRYIKQYPQAANSRDASIALAALYKKDKQWLAAAPLLEKAAQNISDPELKQTAALEIADLYYKGEDTEQAIRSYSNLIESTDEASTLDYESTATARGRLVDLYKQTRQYNKALQMMEQYVVLDLKANQATPQTREVAEDYALTLAQTNTKRYQSVALTGNLQQSFKRKQQAMQTAITSYKRLEAFNSERSTSAAHAGIGDIFNHLSQALLNAPVPGGLSELEQEEYMIIVEEQAFPFEEKAVQAHEKNINQLHQGQWHEGIEQSLESLAELLPARFNKRERFEGAITHAE